MTASSLCSLLRCVSERAREYHCCCCCMVQHGHCSIAGFFHCVTSGGHQNSEKQINSTRTSHTECLWFELEAFYIVRRMFIFLPFSAQYWKGTEPADDIMSTNGLLLNQWKNGSRTHHCLFLVLFNLLFWFILQILFWRPIRDSIVRHKQKVIPTTMHCAHIVGVYVRVRVNEMVVIMFETWIDRLHEWAMNIAERRWHSAIILSLCYRYALIDVCWSNHDYRWRELFIPYTRAER